MTVTIGLNVDKMLAVHSKYWRTGKQNFLKLFSIYMQRKDVLCWYVYQGIFKREKRKWDLFRFLGVMALLLNYAVLTWLSVVVLFLDGPYQFDFVILVAGFKSRQKQHDSLYLKPITTPSLHVFGDTDKVIPKGKK